MTDLVDAAQAREEEDRQAALDRFRRRAGRAEGRGDCMDCGEAIPPARRAAWPAAERCVECQEARERS